MGSNDRENCIHSHTGTKNKKKQHSKNKLIQLNSTRTIMSLVVLALLIESLIGHIGVGALALVVVYRGGITFHLGHLQVLESREEVHAGT